MPNWRHQFNMAQNPFSSSLPPAFRMDFSVPRRSIYHLQQCVFLSLFCHRVTFSTLDARSTGWVGWDTLCHSTHTIVGRQCVWFKKLGHTLEAQCGKIPHFGKKHYFSVQACHCLFSEWRLGGISSLSLIVLLKTEHYFNYFLQHNFHIFL